MKARYVAGVDLESLLDPEGRAWKGSVPETLDLIGTPAALQPTAALRIKYLTEPVGTVGRVAIDAAHNGEQLAFRIAWDDPTGDRDITDTTGFVDGAAVAFPSVVATATTPASPMITMGAAGMPVNVWYWRADEDGAGRHLVAEGIGTTRTLDRELVRGRGVWKDGRWRVVIARALRVQTTEPAIQLSPGDVTGFGVAIWDGSHQERGGIKTFSGDWRELVLAPVSG